jgi:hypothetical protein
MARPAGQSLNSCRPARLELSKPRRPTRPGAILASRPSGVADHLSVAFLPASGGDSSPATSSLRALGTSSRANDRCVDPKRARSIDRFPAAAMI